MSPKLITLAGLSACAPVLMLMLSKPGRSPVAASTISVGAGPLLPDMWRNRRKQLEPKAIDVS